MKVIYTNLFIALILSSSLALAVPATPAPAANATDTPVSQPVKLAPVILAKGVSDFTQQWMTLEQQKLWLQQQLLSINQQQFMLLQQHIALKNAPKTDLRWQPEQDGAFPKDAIVGGLSGNQTLYICHAQFLDKGTHPGQLGKTGCMISYGGRSLIEKNYAVLAGQQAVEWKPSSAVNNDDRFEPGPVFIPPPPPNSTVIINPIQPMPSSYPVIGGHEQDHPILICRTIYGNEIHIGKVVNDSCNISAQNMEVVASMYEVLFIK